MNNAGREIFGNIPQWQHALFYWLAGVSIAIFTLGILNRVRRWTRGEIVWRLELAGIPQRIRYSATHVLAQPRLRKQPSSGAMHLLIFWGFLFLFAGTNTVAVEHYGGSGIVPAAVARALGAAYLSNVAAVRLAGERVEVERKLERGNRQVWSAALPAVAVEPGTLLPRYLSVAALILARRRAVETITPAALGVDPGSLARLTDVKRLAAPRRRPKKTAAPIATQVAGGSRQSLIMSNLGVGSGTMKEKKLLTGAPDEIATAIVNLLIEREVFARERS